MGADAVDTAELVLPGHWCRPLAWAPSGRFGRGRYVGKTAWPAFPPCNPSAHVFPSDENGGR